MKDTIPNTALTKPKFVLQVYDLKQSWDLATATRGEQFSEEPEIDDDELKTAFHGQGLAIFCAGYGDHEPSVYRFETKEPWDITEFSGGTASQVLSLANEFSAVTSISFNTTGTQMFVRGYKQIEGGLSAYDQHEIRKFNRQIAPAENCVEPHAHCKSKRDWVETTLYCVLAFCLFGMAFSGFKVLQLLLN
jgi:hypothetical protein